MSNPSSLPYKYYLQAGQFDLFINLSKVKLIRDEIQKINTGFSKFIESQINYAKIRWEGLEDQAKSEIKRDTFERKYERFIEHSKIIRSEVLANLSNEWFSHFWKIRSELEKQVAILRLGPLFEVISRNLDWEGDIIAKMNPIVLRLRRPTKPKKGKRTVNSMVYDVSFQIETMLRPMAIELSSLLSEFKKISLKKEILKKENEFVNSDENEILAKEILNLYHSIPQSYWNKVYRKLFVVREHITLLTQASTPRKTPGEFA